MDAGANLLLLGVIIATSDAEVSELVRVLGGSDDAKVVAELLLLQVPLGEVLKLTLGEAKVGGGGNG